MKVFFTTVLFVLLTQNAFGATSINPVEKQPAKVWVQAISTTDSMPTSVARLYRYKNSRIKKALEFRTKRNANKLA